MRPCPNSGRLCPSSSLRSDRSSTVLAHLVQKLWNKMCFCHFSTRPLHTSESVTPKGHMVPHALCYADVSQFDGKHFGTSSVSVSRALFSAILCKIYPKTLKIACSDVTATPNRDRIRLNNHAPPRATRRHHCRFLTTILSGVIPTNPKIGIFVLAKDIFSGFTPNSMGAYSKVFLVGR